MNPILKALFIFTVLCLADAALLKREKNSKDDSHIPVLVCYEGENQTGESVTLYDSMNLSRFRFDDRASSCCFTGTWVLYEDINGNKDNPKGISMHGWGENYCVNLDPKIVKKASSISLVGIGYDYMQDTINMYEFEHFNGEETFESVDEIPEMRKDNFGRSMIVTGCSPWTLYQDPHFQGKCVCLMPADEEKCEPKFYHTEDSLAGFATEVSSIRRGCFCDLKI